MSVHSALYVPEVEKNQYSVASQCVLAQYYGHTEAPEWLQKLPVYKT